MNILTKLKECNVRINDEDKLNRFLSEKSHYRYNKILDKLLNYGISLSDTHLNDFYRYDIRLRRLLFKYLTAYEIVLKGKILNEITEGFENVEKLSFGQLIDKYYFNYPELRKVKNLRNLIFHHRMIQLENETMVIEAILIMLKRLNKIKFFEELEDLQKGLTLIKSFMIDNEVLKYDFIRRE